MPVYTSLSLFSTYLWGFPVRFTPAMILGPVCTATLTTVSVMYSPMILSDVYSFGTRFKFYTEFSMKTRWSSRGVNLACFGSAHASLFNHPCAWNDDFSLDADGGSWLELPDGVNAGGDGESRAPVKPFRGLVRKNCVCMAGVR